MFKEKNELEKVVTDRIIKRAEELGLSQNDIAKATKNHRSTVSGWFAGSIPRPEKLKDLRRVLRCSQDYLEGVTQVPGAKNESELLTILDKTWELKANELIKTNIVLVPAHDSESIDTALAFPTVLLNSIDDVSKLAYFKTPRSLYIFDRNQTKPNTRGANFIFLVGESELTTGVARRSLDGVSTAKVHGQAAQLDDNEHIKILGKVVYLGEKVHDKNIV